MFPSHAANNDGGTLPRAIPTAEWQQRFVPKGTTGPERRYLDSETSYHPAFGCVILDCMATRRGSPLKPCKRAEIPVSGVSHSTTGRTPERIRAAHPLNQLLNLGYGVKPSSIQSLKRESWSGDHGSSQGMLPSSSRAKISDARALTSSYEERSRPYPCIESMSGLSRKSGGCHLRSLWA
jgi:hypothetical protein